MLLLIVTIFFCFVFAFFNGFSDAANSIATVVATRVLKPFQAVLLAAIGNFLGISLGTAVAETIGKEIIDTSIVDYHLILAALIGGLIFDFGTWFLGLPISESHVLIGGLMGAGIAAASVASVNFSGVIEKVIVPMIFSPLIAGVVSFILIVFVLRIFSHVSSLRMNFFFRFLQMISAFFLSVAHGANDGQKVVGLVTMLLIKEKILPAFHPPLILILAIYTTVAIGTLCGGWRIVKTMARRITHLYPYQGFCAEAAGALVLSTTAIIGFPVSTTHAISGAICGVGMTRRRLAVKWKMAREIVIAWGLTIPMSALFSFMVYYLLKLII